MADRPRYLPHDLDRLREQQARPPHALRGHRRRCHRALAPDARRRHAVPDRDRRALDQHRPGRGRRGPPDARLRRREGRPVQDGRGRPRRSAPDRFIRTTDPDHVRAAQEMVRRAHANGDIYLGTYEGWYCPNEGFRNATDVLETRARDDLPEPPRGPPPVADRAELVLPPVGLPGATRAPFRRAPGVRPARLPAQRDARLHPRRARGLLDQPRADAGRLGDPVPDRRERRVGAARGRLVGPRGRQDLRLVRRAHQLHHGRGLPGRPGRVRATGGRPTCTSSARTSPGSTRSSGRRCCGAPGSRRRARSGSTAGCSRPAASG